MVSVIWGRISPPSWEKGFIATHVDNEDPMNLVIHGELKRKFEREAMEIIEVTKKIVKKGSIYRSRAVELNLSFLQNGEAFNPDKHAPNFLDTSKKLELILPKAIEFELNISIWDSIRKPEAFRKNNIPIKHGILLTGKFGTGKSLTAARTAQICAENDFTFFYLKTPDQFIAAHRLAHLYSPSVLFVEDIDQIFGGDRDGDMNELLETLDGVSSKKADIITIFTSNFPSRINEAFKRPGRVDTHIQFTPPDAEAAARFVQLFAGENLSEEAIERLPEIGVAFEGLVPAAITEGVHKAKRRAIGEFGADIKGKLTPEFLLTAAEVMQQHNSSMEGDDIHPDTKKLEQVRSGFDTVLRRDDPEGMKRLAAALRR
jgi:hypothetical protein